MKRNHFYYIIASFTVFFRFRPTARCHQEIHVRLPAGRKRGGPLRCGSSYLQLLLYQKEAPGAISQTWVHHSHRWHQDRSMQQAFGGKWWRGEGRERGAREGNKEGGIEGVEGGRGKRQRKSRRGQAKERNSGLTGSGKVLERAPTKWWHDPQSWNMPVKMGRRRDYFPHSSVTWTGPHRTG